MCGSGGCDSGATITASQGETIAFPMELYSKLTDAHCHIQDDRENIYQLVQSWTTANKNNELEGAGSSSSSSSSSSNLVPLCTGKVCLMGVQPSKDLGILETDSNEKQDENIESVSAKTNSLSLTSTNLRSTSTSITTVTWNETDTKGDWDLVSKLAHNHPDRFIPCFGIHPWFTHKYRSLEAPSGSNVELRGVTSGKGEPAVTTPAAVNSALSPPVLSFSSKSVTQVPDSGVQHEAFLAMSKQLQDHMARETHDEETGVTQEESGNQQRAIQDSQGEARNNNELSTAQPIVTISKNESQDRSKIGHYKKVLSVPNSVAKGYLEDLAQHLPEPRDLEPALQELRRKLVEHPDAVLGEIGLDRTARILEPIGTTDTDERREQKRTTHALTIVQHQLDIVREQLKIAASLGRAVSFHCVQAYGHWHDFLIHEGKRLKQWEIDQGYYQRQIQQIHASGGTAVISPISPAGVKLSKNYTARLQREARDAAWERHVASTLQESSDEEDDEDEDEEEKDEDEDDETTVNSDETPKLPVAPFEVVLPPRLCMHSYGGSVDMLKAFVKMDHPPEVFFSFSILINGRLQDKKLKELIMAVPEDRLLVESDHHSHIQVDNLLVEMVHKIAETRGWTLEETVEKTSRNWNRFVYG
ncbi:hypothetical protein BGZ76_005800 [Entomortierella beljakovae]|nr:hypothetical protein BGZ76_005800 [Entomortierella beljakovae]